MTNRNNKQFISINNIDFIQDLTPETAANCFGGACISANTTSTSEAGNQRSSSYSYKGMEYLNDSVDTNTSGLINTFGFNPYEDLSTWNGNISYFKYSS